MKPSEFREGIAKAIHDRINKREIRQIEWADELSWVQEQHQEEADAVIAYMETADLIYVENDGGELIGWPLAAWLKEGK